MYPSKASWLWKLILTAFSRRWRQSGEVALRLRIYQGVVLVTLASLPDPSPCQLLGLLMHAFSSPALVSLLPPF